MKNNEIARCGLACFLCRPETSCGGCHADECFGKDWCEVRKCCLERGFEHCFECSEAADCLKGVHEKITPHGFTIFARIYGEQKLIECLEKNQKFGIKYQKSKYSGDYDEFENIQDLLEFIKTGTKQ